MPVRSSLAYSTLAAPLGKKRTETVEPLGLGIDQDADPSAYPRFSYFGASINLGAWKTNSPTSACMILLVPARYREGPSDRSAAPPSGRYLENDGLRGDVVVVAVPLEAHLHGLRWLDLAEGKG